MNISGISSKSAVGKLLRLPLRLIPDDMVMPIMQGALRGKKWIAGSSNHGCWLGSYEHEKQKLFVATIRKGTTVFDIGANVGFYTLLASVAVSVTGRVYAFEPLQRNVGFLRRHIHLNQIKNAAVYEVAVSDHSGSSRFEEGPSPLMGRLAENGRLTVPTISLDDLIASGECPLPDVLKIDVEGGELAVLSGAEQLLKDHRPKLFLATHGVENHRHCCEFLQSLGYRLEAIGEGAVGDADEVLAS